MTDSADTSELCFMTAREQARLIRDREVSARELMAEYLDRIARINPQVNAIVAKLDDERCLALADEADRCLNRGEIVGPLHGLPHAFKDFEPAVGFPFTMGSPVFQATMPKEDSVLVERLRTAGCLPIGKTNIPEFAMGSHTYNNVYGLTRNPYDVSKSAGGSSGGAAAAVATGMLPLADGSDLGGSLRNPASFNNIIGFRPSVGLVPMAPSVVPSVGFGVKGPLARSVGDIALLLTVMAGSDPRDPSCYPSNPSVFSSPLEPSLERPHVAWCLDLGGLPIDPRVRAVLDGQRRTFESLGCHVEDACPDLSDADEVFVTIRQWKAWIALGPVLKRHRDQMKPEAIWEIERGAALTSSDVARAMVRHGELLARVREFQERFDFLVCTTSQVPPFDATLDWPREIAGVPMQTYVDWMKSAYWISATMCPAISMPAGFTDQGLPVGVQIVGAYRHDFDVLKMARAFERATNFADRRPAIALQ
jgi:amidase